MKQGQNGGSDRQEVVRENARLMQVVFNDRRRTDRLDLEVAEMAMGAATSAGSSPRSSMLKWPQPANWLRCITSGGR